MNPREPKSLDDVSNLLDRVTEIDIEIEAVVVSTKQQIADLRADLKREKKALNKKKNRYISVIRKFLSNRKASMLKKWGTKSVRLGSGIVGWRRSSRKIQVSRGREDDIIAELQKRKKKHLLRTKVIVELNKEALLKEPELVAKLAGIKIVGGSRDTFFVETDPLEDKKPH